jgi:hypothetical protein
VASEKEGWAVNKKGLTLKELLQQTSHYSPKVRRGNFLLLWRFLYCENVVISLKNCSLSVKGC